LSESIRSTSQFISDLRLTPTMNPTCVLGTTGPTTNEYCDQSVKLLSRMLAGDALKMNGAFSKALYTVIYADDRYKSGGLTRCRLRILGDVILEIHVVWSIIKSLLPHILSFVCNKKSQKIVHFGQFISEMKEIWTNNNSLGYRLAEGHLDQFILRFTRDEQEDIRVYKQKIKMEKQIKQKGNLNDNLMSDLQTQKSPLGWVPNCNAKKKWPLKTESPSVLGECFKELLGAIFVGSNPDMFDCETDVNIEWNIEHCARFLKNYLGNENM